MDTYHELLRHVLQCGQPREDRTGTGTLSIFGYQMRFDLEKGFPLLTTKKVHLPSVVHELLWFLRGETNIAYLKKNKVRIWDAWADTEGNLGPIYGYQWRHWTTSDGKHIDQIARLVAQIKEDPYSRRHLVSAWNVGDLAQMALPPCHTLFQFHVQGKKLSCQLYQRSGDIFLGVPFNIASYALLTCMVAHVCGLQRGSFVHTLGDAHLYQNHIAQAQLQLTRTPRTPPKLLLNPSVKDIFSFTYADISVHGYDPHPAIQAPIAV